MQLSQTPILHLVLTPKIQSVNFSLVSLGFFSLLLAIVSLACWFTPTLCVFQMLIYFFPRQHTKDETQPILHNFWILSDITFIKQQVRKTFTVPKSWLQCSSKHGYQTFMFFESSSLIDVKYGSSLGVHCSTFSPLLFPSFLFLPTSKFISFFRQNNLTLCCLFSIYAFKALHSLPHHPCLIKLFSQYSSLEEIYFHLENKFFFSFPIFASSITRTRSKEGREGGNNTSSSQ